MKKNMGTADRTVRILVALAIGYLYFSGRVGGTLGIILLIVAVVFLLTSLVGSCPGYIPLKFSTRGKGGTET